MNETNVYGVNQVGEPAATAKVAVDNSDNWSDFDFNAVNIEKPRVTRPLPGREIWRFAIVGFLSGIAVWLVRLALEAWVMKPIFCRTPDTAAVCASAGATSFVIALVLVGAIATSVLVRQRTFRAFLITIATFASLGALWPILSKFGIFGASVISALFAAGLYLFFALIAAIKRYVLAVVLLAALVIAFWLVARA